MVLQPQRHVAIREETRLGMRDQLRKQEARKIPFVVGTRSLFGSTGFHLGRHRSFRPQSRSLDYALEIFRGSRRTDLKGHPAQIPANDGTRVLGRTFFGRIVEIILPKSNQSSDERVNALPGLAPGYQRWKGAAPTQPRRSVQSSECSIQSKVGRGPGSALLRGLRKEGSKQGFHLIGTARWTRNFPFFPLLDGKG